MNRYNHVEVDQPEVDTPIDLIGNMIDRLPWPKMEPTGRTLKDYFEHIGDFDEDHDDEDAEEEDEEEDTDEFIN